MDEKDLSASRSGQSTGKRQWLHSIGPGLVSACVVIGPGSILTSSQLGAKDGYSKSWVVIISVFFMVIYTTLGAKLGVVSQQSTGDLVRRYCGSWLAIMIGLGVFFISAAFQFGNNLGIHSALSTYIRFDYWIVLFNAVTILFVFAYRDLYRIVERLMACLVALMLISFALNLWFARPAPTEFLAGLVPRLDKDGIQLPLLGLVGTTFCISVPYYHAYLVRFKGWKQEDVRSGMIDARVGGVIMAVITLMIMSTAAAVLFGRDLNELAEVANQLQPLFGERGRVIFCLGVFAAAFSSFLVNSMIGGFVLADGLKLGNTPSDFGPRIFTTAVLLVGMCVALFVIKTGVRPVAAIVAAQAVTVLAAPLMAATLLWLTNIRSVMGDNRNGIAMNIAAALGLVLLIFTAWYTAAYNVWPAIQNMLAN